MGWECQKWGLEPFERKQLMVEGLCFTESSNLLQPFSFLTKISAGSLLKSMSNDADGRAWPSEINLILFALILSCYRSVFRLCYLCSLLQLSPLRAPGHCFIHSRELNICDNTSALEEDIEMCLVIPAF